MTDREKVISRADIVANLLDQARDKDALDNGEGGVFAHDADVLRAAVEMLTVDAIPMDWLDAQIRGYASRLMSTELKALTMVKGMWEADKHGDL